MTYLSRFSLQSVSKQLIPLGFLLFILAVVFGVSLLWHETRPYQEVSELSGKQFTFAELSLYFQDLAERKGAVYAFEVLKRVELPPNIDLHLLGHVVGDELYKQQGVEGMGLCTHDFRNACSHTVVIGALLEYGEGVLSKVQEACQNAPGGKGAYTMCFHGFGHGVLAYNEYDFPSTISLCKKTGTEAYHDREYIECVGGAVMEILGGGGHDRERWLEKREEYLSKTDPLSLCDASFMPKEARPICYTYLTPHLFTFAGGDLGFPTEEDFKNAFQYCEKIPKNDSEDRRACLGGPGKEFVVLAQDRDIRKIESMTNDQLRTVYRWCSLGGTKESITDCVVEAMQSLYWGGENNRDVAERFCGIIDDNAVQGDCFAELTGAVKQYIDDPSYYEAFCSEIPEVYQRICRERLL
jgi:hypothetical protein